MKKYTIFILVVVFSLVSISAFAQTESATTSDSVLEVENLGTLPSSPFYFLKEWRRGITKFFTFDPIKKAELELNEINERAAEIKKLEELSSENTEALSRAIGNYQENVDRLKTRLEALQETSENPNIEKLLENLVERSIRHQELFDTLQEKFFNKEELKEQLRVSREKMGEVLSEMPNQFENGEIIRERVQSRILNQITSSSVASSSAVRERVREEVQERKELNDGQGGESSSGTSSGILAPIKNAINGYLQEKKDEVEEKKREVNCIQVITPAVSPEGECREFSTPCDVPSDWKNIEECQSNGNQFGNASSSDENQFQGNQ